MAEEKNKPSVFTYLDRVMGQDGIKTSNKLEITIDRNSAITLAGIGVGLVIFNHLLGIGMNKLFNAKG